MEIDFDLKGKNALVTGAGGSIGKTCARFLAQSGANIMLSDLDEALLKRAAEEICAECPTVKVEYQTCNVVKKDEVDALVDATVDRFGRIDIFQQIVGASTKIDFLEFTEEQYDFYMDINFRSTFLLNQAVLKAMIPNRSGKIVNMSSMSGKEGYPTNVVYTASKFAVTGLTQAVAKLAAPYNINVNAVCPGIVRTRIWDKILDDVRKSGGDPEAYWEQRIGAMPLKRPQTPEDIAHMFLYLSSSFADNMTGQAINVTGGLILH